MVVVFATYPGALSIHDTIDYSMSGGKILFESSVAAFTPQYNGDQADMTYFLNQIHSRGRQHGWDTLLFEIPVGDQTVPNIKLLLTQHGQISIADMRNAAAIYMVQENQAKQAACQLLTLLTNSLDKGIARKLMLRKAEYTVNGKRMVQQC